MKNLAIDIGSRFADLAYTDGTQLQVLKYGVSDLSEGTATLAAISAAVSQFDINIAELDSLRIGSTGALNAVLKRKGARVALLATHGFTDTFFLARQNRQDLYNPVAASRSPTFLLDAADVYGVTGRIDANGQEVSPLDKAAFARTARKIATSGVEAIALCLLFAHLNPAHELACAQILADHCPDLQISMSHRVDPQPREYERSVSTCLDAWLKPRFIRTTSQISEGLTAQGFRGQLLFGDGRGALMSQQTATALPAAALASGPAAAARYGATLSAQKPDRARLIMDIGSVSCDLSYAPAGVEPPLVSAAVYGGVPLRREMVDLHSFSLGARHGAVLSSGQHLLFKLDPDANTPSLELALRTAGRIAPPVTADEIHPLTQLAAQAGWADAQEAAQHIIAAAELEIATQIVNFAVRRNIDPAQAQLVAMGGLGPVLAVGIADVLSLNEVLLPQAPAAAGALGLLGATVRCEASAPLGLALADITPQTLPRVYEILLSKIKTQAAEIGACDLTPPTAVITMAATAQMHPLQIEMTPPPATNADIAAAFIAAYQSRFAIAPPADGYVFALMLRLDGAESDVHMATPPTQPPPQLPSTVFETLAGTAHVPALWQISAIKGGYALCMKEHTT